MKEDLEMELETSEEYRASLKQDLLEINERIVVIEEELYESKNI